MTSRVALVVHATRFGGAEFYIEQLCRHLPPRFAPVLLVVEPIPAKLREVSNGLGIETIEIPSLRGKLDVRGWRHLWRALESANVDLFHFNLVEPTNNRHPMALCALRRRPFVLTLHAVFAIRPAWYRRLIGAVFARSRRAIAVSSEIATALEADFGVPQSEIRIVRNGVPERPMAPTAERDVVRIGAVGRLSPQKGFDLLIEAVRALVHEGLQIELLVWGDGGQLEELERASAGLPIQFVGTTMEVADFLASVDVFCLPSRWEGLPFALLEAMMAGRPCICSEVGDVGLALGGAGVMVPPEDVDALAAAMTALVGDPVRRGTLGRAAHERAVRLYTSPAMVAVTAEMYDDVLG